MEKLLRTSFLLMWAFAPVLTAFAQAPKNPGTYSFPCAQIIDTNALSHSPGWKIDAYYMDQQFRLDDPSAYLMVLKFRPSAIVSMETEDEIVYGSYTRDKDSVLISFPEEPISKDSADRDAARKTVYFPKRWKIQLLTPKSLVITSLIAEPDDATKLHLLEWRLRARRP
jgi:hypothetical protein